MATASPTPFPVTGYGYGRSSRTSNIRPRRFQSTAPPLRSNSPPSVLDQSHGFAAGGMGLQRISIGDSSDDDIPVPMHFSALTKALLEDRPIARERSPVVHQFYTRNHDEGSAHITSQSRAGTPSRGVLRISRRSPIPTEQESSHSPPRIIHLSASKVGSGLQKAASVSAGLRQQDLTDNELAQDLVTPAPYYRDRQTSRSRAESVASEGRSAIYPDETAAHSNALALSQSRAWQSGHDASNDHGNGNLLDSSTRGMTRSAAEGMPSSLRVKRVPVGSGTFLRGAPLRRGFRRRQSDENQSPGDEALPSPLGDEPEVHDSEEMVNENSAEQSAPETPALDAPQKHEDRDPRPQQVERPALADHRRDAFLGTTLVSRSSRQPSPIPASQADGQIYKHTQPEQVFKIPALPPVLSSMHDQENEPPNTFKRTKPAKISILGNVEKIEALARRSEAKVHPSTAGHKSPPRAALAVRSLNTPHRAPPPPPPPPKMTALETATAVGGASTVKKKKRSHFSINGKMYAARGKIGKGGSSDVYRVMAENDKIFALKRVDLGDCNEETVRGYKGEIDLLKRLENVDRVVRLFDWEVNEQKQSLSVVSRALSPPVDGMFS